MHNRHLKQILVGRFQRKYSRLVALTGARQVGKTTLVREAFSEIPYISVEDPVARPAYTRFSAAEWVERYPSAIIDEVQKAPSIVEAIKAAHDLAGHVRYLLLGSSQILLLSKVKESLAGRVALEELWPLTLPEIGTTSWEEPVRESRLIEWLKDDPRRTGVLLGVPAASRPFSRYTMRFERYLRFGGMPVVHDPDIDDRDREDWLRNYQRTFLERDLADLSNLKDLEPFVLAQRAAAANTGCLVNFSDLARTASISHTTAKRFLRYLELSYQVLVLQPYHRNPSKRLSKMPKLHFLDPGVLRSLSRRTGPATGQEFESAVVGEIYKQVRTVGLRVEVYHLRTYDGREIDLLVELDDGFVGIEVKMSRRVFASDATAFRGLQEYLDKPLLHSLILSQDVDARLVRDGVTAIPAAWALSPRDS